MKKIKSSRAITLIALVIIIVVLLILSLIAIKSFSDNEIITKAKETKRNTSQAEAKEKVNLAMQEWETTKLTDSNITFESFLNNRFDNVKDEGNGTYTVTIGEEAWKYKLKEDGTIEDLNVEVKIATGEVLTLDNNKKGIKTEDNLVYIANDDGETATVYSYIEGMTIYMDAIQLMGKTYAATGDIEIASKAAIDNKEYLVTNVGEYAFGNLVTGGDISSVIIPNSVIKIGKHAFVNCTNLESVKIGNNVSNIAEGVFSNCTGINQIDIPNSVVSIGNFTFESCTGIKHIIIPESVTSMGIAVFNNWTKTQEVSVWWQKENRPENWNKDWDKIQVSRFLLDGAFKINYGVTV